MSKWFHWWTPDGKNYRSVRIGMTIPNTVSDKFFPADERYVCHSRNDLPVEKSDLKAAASDWELEQEHEALRKRTHKRNGDTMIGTSKSDVASEVAWVIEMTEGDRAGRPPIYWGQIEEGEGWTRDIKEAFRFKTFHDADMRASDCGIPDYEVIEHAWSSPLVRQAPPSSSEGGQ